MVIIDLFGRSTTANQPTARGTISFISDYVNFLPGTHWEKYYYGNDQTITTKKLFLFPSYFNGDNTGNIAVTGTAFAKYIDLDFDLTIKGERLIGGDCLLNVEFVHYDRGTGGNTTKIIAKIVHYDGTTKTTLATLNGAENYTESSNTVTQPLKGTIITKHFKIGDILRVTIEVWAKHTESNGEVVLIHDGGETDNTGKSWVHIPYIRLDEY
uniref:Uncharacterized protein n=1 Tax=viral metagenome TaxID=1070528 RepID=A0A6H1ZTM8_9ZZZZ